jgi:hypothetical protein
MSIFQSAIDNWPEDEAASVIDSYKTARLDDPEYAAVNLHHDIEHFAKVFSFEPDAAALNARFLAVLKKEGII